MNILNIKLDNRAVNVSFTKNALHLLLADGREISAPLSWFPRLQEATNEQRKHWRLIGNGIGIHWSDIDEDIAVKTLTSNSL